MIASPFTEVLTWKPATDPIAMCAYLLNGHSDVRHASQINWLNISDGHCLDNSSLDSRHFSAMPTKCGASLRTLKALFHRFFYRKFIVDLAQNVFQFEHTAEHFGVQARAWNLRQTRSYAFKRDAVESNCFVARLIKLAAKVKRKLDRLLVKQMKRAQGISLLISLSPRGFTMRKIDGTPYRADRTNCLNPGWPRLLVQGKIMSNSPNRKQNSSGPVTHAYHFYKFRHAISFLKGIVA